MSGECEDCGEHAMECICHNNAQLYLAMTAMKMRVNTFTQVVIATPGLESEIEKYKLEE